MSELKTKITDREIKKFLDENFAEKIRYLKPLTGGEISQAFSFRTDSGEFVIRINSARKSFEKDKYAYKNFSSKRVPIPEMFKLGMFSSYYYYAITRKAKGKILDEFSYEEIQKLMPEIISTLQAIHSTKLSENTKYGEWDSNGKAEFESWKDYLISIGENPYYEWSKILKETMMEEKHFNQCYSNLISLVEFCPEKRYLVHGDYGFDNVLSDGKSITAVVDWGNSMYGDFLFDIVWLFFWGENFNYAKEIYARYKSTDFNFSKFEKRLLCYASYIALGALHLFAKSEQKSSYKWTYDRILSVMDNLRFT